MEEGSLRCDANVSVRCRGESRFGTKTEVKNMNSFRNVERALAFEINRQIGLVEDGRPVVQETLLWDATRGVATAMRSKEEAHDYRYFPEPDLVPVYVDETWIARVRADLPELPRSRKERFVAQLGLPQYDAEVLTADRSTAEYFEETLRQLSEISSAPGGGECQGCIQLGNDRGLEGCRGTLGFLLGESHPLPEPRPVDQSCAKGNNQWLNSQDSVRGDG